MSAIHSPRRSPEALRGRSFVLLVLGILAAPLTAGVVPLSAQQSSAQQSPEEREAGRHLGHIMSGWEETPEGRGLLAVAVAETQVASRHATLAVRSSENLEAMKGHARHVLHALDPSRVESGPGLGYGVIRVSEEIADHIQLAVEAVGYAGNIANRAPVVTQSADNAARWAREMVDVIEQIQAAETPSEAEPLARELRTLANRVVSGADLNDDDEIRWQDGEGGIMHVQQHMSLLMRVDGRWYFDRTEVGPADDSGATDGGSGSVDRDSGSGHGSGHPQEPNQPAQQDAQQEAEEEVIVHLGEILSSSTETPRSQGLLAIAVSEAEAAARHAGFVAEAGDLPTMQQRARRVLHALDPNRAPDVNTPGMGYGAIRAAEDISTHVNLAREVDDVSAATTRNLDTHGPAIAQSAENAARWSRQMIGLVEQIRMAESVAQAEPLAAELESLGDRVLSGEDLDGDGRIRWQDGEGGILQVQEHMNLLMAEIGQ